VAEVRVNDLRMTAEELHKRAGDAYGWALIRSNDYRAFPRNGKFVFQGYGFGHGVGLCQAGAEARGRAGHRYRQILAFYFPGTRAGISAQGLSWAHGAGERVEAFAATEAEARELCRSADRALMEAERRLGVRVAVRPRIRAYPQVSIFRDATGEPGSVAAATRGATIRMQPPALLRAKGVLETTLLHEMLHVAMESHARAELPGWFREGVVLYLAGDRGADALYRDARSRVDRLVATHGRAAVLGWVASGFPRELANSEGKR
jgi:stage II sporulation protein D